MLQKLLDETTKIYERFKGITEEPKEGLPGLLNIDIVAATMLGGVPIRAKEPLQVCGPLEEETSTLRPVRVANMLVVGEESPLRVSHPGPINIGTVDNVTSVTEVQGVLEVTSVANVVNVDTVLSVTEVADVATVGAVTNVLSVGTVGTVSEVTSVSTVDVVNSVVEVMTVGEVTNVVNVDDVTTVATVGEVTNVLSVAEVIDVATVAAVGAVATVATVEEVASVTIVESVASVIAVGLVSEVAHVTGGSSVEVTNFPATQAVLVTNSNNQAVPIKTTSTSPVVVTVDNYPTQQHVFIDNSVSVANFPSQQHVVVDNRSVQQHVVVDNLPSQQHVVVDGNPHVTVDNWPNEQHVIVDNTPTTNVQGTVNAHIVRNQNDPLNIQPVVLMGPETDGQYWRATSHTIDYRNPGNAPMQDQYNSQIQDTTIFYSHQNSLHHNHIHMYTDNGGI